MKTRTKLIAGFAGVIMLALVAFHMTANIYTDLKRQFNILEDDIFPSVLRMSEIEREAETLFRTTMDYSITGSAGAREAAISGKDYLSELGIAHFQQEARLGTEEEAAARELTQKIATFGSAVNTIVILKDQQTDGAILMELEKERLSPALGALRESASRHKDYLLAKMTNTEEAIRKAENLGMLLLLSGAALITLAAIVLAFFISRSIVRPLLALRQGAEIIGQGNLDYTVGTKAGDEIGQLSRAFDQMTRDLRKKTTSIDNLNREIGERQRAEDALRESEEKYRAIFEQATDSIVLIDINTNEIFDFNDRTCENLGYTREEFAKLKLSDIDIVETAEETKERNEKIWKAGENSFETKHRTKTGEIRDISVNVRALDYAGKSLGLCLWHDITESKRAVEALRQSEGKYRAIFEQAIDSIAIIDIESGEIHDFNDKAHESLGYTREEFARLKIFDIDPNLKIEAPSGEEHGKLMGKGTEVFEAKHRTKSGEIRDARVSTTLICLDGRLTGICIWHDITERKQAEKALRESEEKYRAIFEQASDSIVLIDMTMRKMADFNDRAYQNLGYTREEFARLRLDDIDIIKSSEDIRKHDEKIEEDGTDTFETKHRTKDGEIRDVLVSARILNIGATKFSLSLWHDITERKQAEEAVRESETRYRAIFEQASDSIVLIDTENETFVDFNDRAYQNLGYTREEFAKLKITDIDVIEQVGTAKKRVNSIEINNGGFFETKHRTKSGEIRNILISAKNLSIDNNKYGLAVWHDITERKQAEDKYRTIIETALDGFSLADMNGRWLDVNDSYCRMTGYTRKEMLQMCIRDIEAVENPKEMANHTKILMERGHDRFESKYRRKDGKIIDVEISVNYLDIEGGRLFTFAHDITRRKKVETEINKALSDLKQSSAQLAAMNKELEAFSYSVSHDLRAPLRTIDGFSQALLEDYQSQLNEEGQDYLQRVRTASQRMGMLIDDLLKLSRLSRSEMHQEKVNLSTLAEEVAAGLEQTEPQRQVEFVISQGLTVSGDRQLLRVVLENLLGNAWKFTSKQPQARIEVGMTGNGHKKEKAYFVRDNGAGFDMNYADKLFRAFQRLHDVTEFPGTGVGLATVQRIIHRHGGRTWAEGSVGKGATFYFTLN